MPGIDFILSSDTLPSATKHRENKYLSFSDKHRIHVWLIGQNARISAGRPYWCCIVCLFEEFFI
jgi:hypothetical protein